MEERGDGSLTIVTGAHRLGQPQEYGELQMSGVGSSAVVVVPFLQAPFRLLSSPHPHLRQGPYPFLLSASWHRIRKTAQPQGFW